MSVTRVFTEQKLHFQSNLKIHTLQCSFHALSSPKSHFSPRWWKRMIINRKWNDSRVTDSTRSTLELHCNFLLTFVSYTALKIKLIVPWQTHNPQCLLGYPKLVIPAVVWPCVCWSKKDAGLHNPKVSPCRRSAGCPTYDGIRTSGLLPIAVSRPADCRVAFRTRPEVSFSRQQRNGTY